MPTAIACLPVTVDAARRLRPRAVRGAMQQPAALDRVDRTAPMAAFQDLAGSECFRRAFRSPLATHLSGESMRRSAARRSAGNACVCRKMPGRLSAPLKSRDTASHSARRPRAGAAVRPARVAPALHRARRAPRTGSRTIGVASDAARGPKHRSDPEYG